jgi:TonB family protein
MSGAIERAAQRVWGIRVPLGVGIALLALGVGGVRWIERTRHAPPPRKAMQFTVVQIQPQTPARPLPPPPPITPPKVVDQPQTTRVELKATDIPPPEAPPPTASSGPAAGPLALAAEGEGPGDAFNLAGNPGGSGLLSGGGLGDGTGGGDGAGVGGVTDAQRYGWYYAKLATEIEDAFRKQKLLTSASTRVELRVWTDASGRVTHLQLVRSTGDPKLDEAIESIVGLRLREPPPRDIPMPMIARLTARRPN